MFLFDQFGETGAMHEQDLNFVNLNARTKFTLKNPGVVFIKDMDNPHFKARIAFNPLQVQVWLQKSLPCITLFSYALDLVLPYRNYTYREGRPHFESYDP